MLNNILWLGSIINIHIINLDNDLLAKSHTTSAVFKHRARVGYFLSSGRSIYEWDAEYLFKIVSSNIMAHPK